MSPGDRITARSITFCSSRMLPGQFQSASAWTAASGMPGTDYRRFMNFLAAHECSVAVREFRTGPAADAAQYEGRRMPSRRIFDCSVVRLRPRRAAAPAGPAMTPPEARSAPRIASRSASTNDIT